MPDPITGAPTIEEQQEQDEQFRLRRASANQPLETPKISGVGGPPAAGVSLAPLPGPGPDVQQAHQRLAGLEGSSSGVDDPGFSQNHPIIHGIAKVGDVLGSIIAPGVTAHIPGTTLYHHAQIAQAQNALNEHEKAAQQEAQTAEETAQAQKAANPTQTPEEQTFGSMAGQTNPTTGQPYTDLERLQQIEQAKQGAHPISEDEKPVEDVAGVNKRLAARYQVLNPGAPLPREFTLQQGAKQRDYKQIDADLQKVEQAQGIKTQQDTTNQAHKDAAAATAATREQSQQDRELARQDKLDRQGQQDQEKHQKDRDAFAQPLQGAIDNADYQRKYANSQTHTGTGDYTMMLQLQEAIVSGQKAGIRFNTAEQARIEHAQSFLNSLHAKYGHLTGGTYFSDDQRHEIADTMESVGLIHKQAIDRWDREHQQGGPKAAGGQAGSGKVLVEGKDF